MKSVLLALIIFAATAARAEIQFNYPKEQPLKVVIASSYSNGYIYQFMNENIHTRMLLDKENTYVYISASGTHGPSHKLRPEEAKELVALAENAASCPVTIEFDRTNFTIIAASAKCDPYR